MTSRKTRKSRRAGRGSVLLIAALLVSSALLRLASGAGIAIAGAATDEDMSASEHMAAEASQGDPASQSLDRMEKGRLLSALQEREARVKVREQQIDLRAKALAIADEEITKRLAALEEAEARLRSTLAHADTAAEDDLAQLTTVYENMKPKDAAALFEAMNPDFAAGFLGRMRPDAAAAILAGLSPDAAYSISVILAGRNANVPKT